MQISPHSIDNIWIGPQLIRCLLISKYLEKLTKWCETLKYRWLILLYICFSCSKYNVLCVLSSKCRQSSHFSYFLVSAGCRPRKNLKNDLVKSNWKHDKSILQSCWNVYPWNVYWLECFPTGMFSYWNVFLLECLPKEYFLTVNFSNWRLYNWKLFRYHKLGRLSTR